MDSPDVPIPLGDDGRWSRPKIEPINLITLLPAPAQLAEEPQITVEGAVELLSRTANTPFTIVEQPQVPDERVKWVALIAGPSQPAPLVIWLEPVRPISDETKRFLKAEGVRWILGVETALQHERAHEHLLSLIQLLGRAFPDAPAILNVNTGAWHPRDELDARLLPEGSEVSPALCYLVHGISGQPSQDHAGSADDPASHIWCYTDGLRTTGRPELEMHGIPQGEGHTSGHLLNSIAELVYASGLPPPGEPFEIGSGLFVRFMPWQDAAAAANLNWLGSTNLRENHDGKPMTGASVAVCALDSLLWPAEVADKINRGEAVMYKTRQATEREARLARRTLDRFVDLVALVPPARRDDSPGRLAAFLVKAGFAVRHSANDRGDDDREHLWFEAMRCEPGGGRIRGRLVNEPVSIAHLRQGQDIWIDRNLISDWQVITQRGRYGPEEHTLARETLENLVREASHA